MGSMGIIGFVFGILGVSMAIIAWGQIANLKNELNDLKKNLEDSGVLNQPAKKKKTDRN